MALATQSPASELYHIRSPIARAIYYRMKHQQIHLHSTHPEWYSVDLQKLPAELAASFVQLHQDEDSTAFLNQCYDKADSLLTQIYHNVAKSVLTWFMSSTSANGLLHRGSMFVLSADQFLLLMGRSADWHAETLLDLGAGDGEVTRRIAPFFDRVLATEASSVMQWRLAKLNYSMLPVESWQDGSEQYDVISLLNLLDRCDKPVDLLQTVRRKLAPGGRVLVAIVLPFSQYVEHAADHRPAQRLVIPKEAPFEAQLATLADGLFKPAGFKVERWSRVPYLCEGDMTQSFYSLDDFVALLEPVESPSH